MYSTGIGEKGPVFFICVLNIYSQKPNYYVSVDNNLGPSYLLGKVKTKIKRDFVKNTKDVLWEIFSSITCSPDYYTCIACSIDNRIGHKAILW